MFNIKKELIIFSVLFVISSLLFHLTSWQMHPFEHFKALFTHSMPYHPLLYVFLIYLVVGILRVVIYLLKKLFSKK